MIRNYLRVLFCAFGSLTTASSLAAQDVSVGLVGAIGLTVQPVDSTYVGSPYLKTGLGGTGGPSASGGLHLTAGHMAVVCEFSAGVVTEDLEGRLVPGGAGKGRLRDTLFSVLVGPQVPIGRSRLQILGGLSRVFGEPTVNGSPVDAVSTDLRRGAFTVGIDLVSPIGPKVAYLGTVRVSPGIERSERAREIGVGRTIVRLGLGVLIELTNR